MALNEWAGDALDWLGNRMAYQMEGAGIPTLGQAAARVNAMQQGQPISQQQGMQGYRMNPADMMAEMMPGGGGAALTIERANKAVPGFSDLSKYFNDAEKALFESNRWQQSAKDVMEHAKPLTHPRIMADVALSGGAKKGWYDESRQAINHLFQNPDYPGDPARFTGLLAAMSPQTSVETNLKNALNTWVNWQKEGRPQGIDQLQRIMSYSTEGKDDIKKLQAMKAWWMNASRALQHQDPENMLLSGPKVNSFFQNLRGNLDEVTNDTWQGYFMGVPQKVYGGSRKIGIDDIGEIGGKGPGYLATNAYTRDAARRAGMEPANIQETTWSWAKGLKELTESPQKVIKNMRENGLQVPDELLFLTDPAGKGLRAEQILESGLLSDNVINATPAFGDLLRMDPYSGILASGGYGGRMMGLPHWTPELTDPISRLGITPQQLRTTRAGKRLMQAARKVGKARK